MWPEQIPMEEDNDEPRSRKPDLVTVLITLLLILAILSTLIWPLLRNGRRPLPAPTPRILQEA
jgi:flagellar biogenesis protein FliO